MTGRVIAITGGQGALGRAVAALALERGLRVAVINHAPTSGTGDILDVGGVDLTDAGQAERAIRGVGDHFGRLDALANIAGGFVWRTVEGAEPAWDRMFALNLTTAVNATRAALPWLRASDAGRIVNVGALGAVKAAAGMGAYAASKAAVHRLTEALAEELKDSSVTANAVLPSILDTPRNRADMPDADPTRWVAPSDLAEVILFLASPASRAVTGALLPVAGRV